MFQEHFARSVAFVEPYIADNSSQTTLLKLLSEFRCLVESKTCRVIRNDDNDGIRLFD